MPAEDNFHSNQPDPSNEELKHAKIRSPSIAPTGDPIAPPIEALVTEFHTNSLIKQHVQSFGEMPLFTVEQHVTRPSDHPFEEHAMESLGTWCTCLTTTVGIVVSFSIEPHVKQPTECHAESPTKCFSGTQS